MTGAAASAPTTTRLSPEHTRDLGRDGSGLITLDRAWPPGGLSLPALEDDPVAAAVLAELLARVEGRRPHRPGPLWSGGLVSPRCRGAARRR